MDSCADDRQRSAVRQVAQDLAARYRRHRIDRYRRVGTAIFGIYPFGESREAARLASSDLIVAGIVGLKLLTPDTH